MRFTGKVAMVTGAGTGIGRATVTRLKAEGAIVVATARNRGGNSLPDAAETVELDVTDEAGWATAMRHIEARWSRLDVLVNNAGIRESGRCEETSLAQWRRLIDTNLTSVFLGCRTAIPLMRRGGGGAIVNVGSITGIRGTENMVAYSASKSGVTAMTASLALDHAADGIRINAIAPAAIRTRMVDGMLEEASDRDLATARLLSKHPIGRVGTPEEAAGVIAFLASEDAGFMTGLTIPVDGGRSIR
jgi:NAD(P)-dependent dehydrogenase (short-subunit alcohol dehydrogenase family)